jgi:hypothetical protein
MPWVRARALGGIESEPLGWLPELLQSRTAPAGKLLPHRVGSGYTSRMHISLGSRTRLLGPCWLLLLLAACGGAPSDEASASAAEPAPEPAPAAPSPAPEPAAAEAPADQPEPAPAPGADAPAAAEPPAAEAALKAGQTKPTAGSATAVAEPAPSTPTAQAKPTASTACGEDGQPRCPLQAFMEDEVDKPLEAADLEQVAAALTKVAKMAPDPAWNAGGAKGFRGMAEASVAAARANDVPALQASCKSCHKAFRRKYKEQFRPRPLP